MSTPLPPFEDLVKPDRFWFLDPAKNIAIFYMPQSSVIRYDIEDSMLADMHPEFLTAVRLLLAWRGKSSGTYIQDTLTLLKGGGTLFKNMNGAPVVFKAIGDAQRFLKDGIHFVRVEGTSFELQDHIHNNATYKLVRCYSERPCDVHVDEMDRSYPGWMQRLRFGRELGLETKELMALVFDNTTSVHEAAHGKHVTTDMQSVVFE